MKSKQSCPKSVRPSTTNNYSTNRVQKQRARCYLCHSLLKSSSVHRYLLVGKSTNDKFNEKMTYADCCRHHLDPNLQSDQTHMFCPKCCQDLQKLHSLKIETERLNEKLRRTLEKSKRLSHVGHKNLTARRVLPLNTTIDERPKVLIKKEINEEENPVSHAPTIPVPDKTNMNQTLLVNYLSGRKQRNESIPVNKNIPNILLDLKQRATSNEKSSTSSSNKRKRNHLVASFLDSEIPKKMDNSSANSSFEQPSMNNSSPSPYAQLMIESPLSSTHSTEERPTFSRRSSSNSEKIPSTIPYGVSMEEEERSMSPTGNDDDISINNESKNGRLSRRQYDFLVKLPDQNSLNTYIETSSAESGSRWTWRRTSANSRGYKVYYVCNFSMRRHYHPCPAAMYALFHPEGSISIYSCGEHKHIPKDRLPVSITDATKDEIFRCLKTGMATTDIRERLIRLQLPFGDARKLNNFIKYHKELLRFGTVTNVRIGGTAYRQPQCWAIRRQESKNGSASSMDAEDKKSS